MSLAAWVVECGTHRPEPRLGLFRFSRSLGALTAFEVARALRRAGLSEPARLFVSGPRAPRLPADQIPLYEKPDDVFRDSLANLRGTPQELLDNRELMDLVSPTRRADCEIADTYEHAAEPPLACPISAFGGVAGFVTPREKREGRREQTSGAFPLRMLPDGHFFVNDARDLVQRAVFTDLVAP